MRKDLETKKDGKVVKFYIESPTADVVSRADRYRAKIWTECLEDGIKTKEELQLMMEERGIWTKAHQKTQDEITQKIQDLEKELYLSKGTKDIKDGVSMAITMRKLRNDLRDHIMKRLSLENNSAEALSDNARFDFLVANCTFYENGEPVYNGISDYNKKASDEIAYAAAASLAEVMYSYDSTQEDNLPENRWLKHFDLVDDDGSLVDENKHLVDLDGRKINEFGHYVNDDGQRIDINGNLLDENGNYIITTNYKKAKKPAARKRAPKKTEAKT